MKLVKSLLLGSAAGLFAAAGAQAADLPRKAAAPVEYVRVCSTYGAGFFFIPGTDTCLRLSGFLRAEYMYVEPFRRDIDATGFRARARVQWDARTATEYGLLRSFIRMEMFRNTGSFVAPGSAFGDQTVVRTGDARESTFSLNKGFIQFGNMTAGRFQSFFDFYANDYNYSTVIGMSDTTTQGFAWTQPFGGGFAATIAIEDPIERRRVTNATSTFIVPGTFIPPAGVPPIGFVPAGARAPDIVANLRVDQAWGAAQLSGALHQIRSVTLIGAAPVPGATFGTACAGAVTFCDFSDDEWGFAVQGGVKINLPQIAAGDELWIQAVYSSGATGYATAGFTTAGVGRLAFRATEAFVNPIDGDIERVDAFSVSAAFRHYWTPNLRSIFFGAYTDFDNNSSGFVATGGVAPVFGIPGTTVTGFSDFRLYEAGASLIWSPVRNLDIGVEAVYRRLDPKGSLPFAVGGIGVGPSNVLPFGAGADGRFFSGGSDDAWEARIRVQRDF